MKNRVKSAMPRKARMTSAIRDPRSSGFRHTKTIEELATEQGVKPLKDAEALRGDFWPDKESVDDFLTWVWKLRHEGRQGD